MGLGLGNMLPAMAVPSVRFQALRPGCRGKATTSWNTFQNAHPPLEWKVGQEIKHRVSVAGR